MEHMYTQYSGVMEYRYTEYSVVMEYTRALYLAIVHCIHSTTGPCTVYLVRYRYTQYTVQFFNLCFSPSFNLLCTFYNINVYSEGKVKLGGFNLRNIQRHK